MIKFSFIILLLTLRCAFFFSEENFPVPPFSFELEQQTKMRGRRLLNTSAPLYEGIGTHYSFIWVGTPPQRVSVIMDTGSHHTAFPCVGCNCGKRVRTLICRIISLTEFRWIHFLIQLDLNRQPQKNVEWTEANAFSDNLIQRVVVGTLLKLWTRSISEVCLNLEPTTYWKNIIPRSNRKWYCRSRQSFSFLRIWLSRIWDWSLSNTKCWWDYGIISCWWNTTVSAL